MGRERSDQCKRLDETECGKTRRKKKLRKNATNAENGKVEQEQGGGGGVKCNKTKGRENRTCALQEIEVERQVQRARRKQRQVMINFNIQSAHIPSNQPEPRKRVIERVNRIKRNVTSGLCKCLVHETHVLQPVPKKLK